MRRWGESAKGGSEIVRETVENGRHLSRRVRCYEGGDCMPLQQTIGVGEGKGGGRATEQERAKDEESLQKEGRLLREAW